LSIVFGLIGAAAALGCGGGSPEDGSDDRSDDGTDDGSQAGMVELGTGTTEWEPLAEETELVLIAGPQGGHHFIVHARMRGMDPGDPSSPGLVLNPTTRFAVTNEAGDRLEIDMAPYRLGYEQVGADFFLPSGRILQVVESEVTAMYGQRARIDLQVTDRDGVAASDSRWVIALEDPNAPPAGR